MLYPTTFFEMLAFQVKVTLCCTAGVPEPAKDWRTGELDALLCQSMVDDVLPVATGATVNV
jgi:hypothetical protein